MRLLHFEMLCMALVSATQPTWEHSMLCDNQDEVDVFDSRDSNFTLD